MKKLLSLTLSFLMIALVFTGCAKAKDTAADAASAAVSDAITAAENGETAEAAEAAEAAVQDVQQNGADSDTASAFYSAYMEAKSDVLTPLMDGIGNNPDTMMSAFSFLGITLSDLYLLPAMYFGLGEPSVAAALAVMGAEDVTYSEQGNNYTVTYKETFLGKYPCFFRAPEEKFGLRFVHPDFLTSHDSMKKMTDPKIAAVEKFSIKISPHITTVLPISQ